ncbi:MAG: hypothetical protein AMS24_03060 [Chlamydiae bacterium SM23_39]|nr:MAG: hypothetical protein AMS24_03060 [Chlamydiae bacterium SM23_39]
MNEITHVHEIIRRCLKTNITFDTPVFLTNKEVLSLKINKYTNRSELPCYKGSYFECKFLELDITEIIRRHSVCSKDTFDLNSEDFHFCVEDINRIGQKSLGLRHVSSFKNACYEAINGMKDGCSLNISFKKSEGPYNKNRFEDLHKKSKEEIKEQLPEYEKGIINFITNSMKMDLNKKIKRLDYPSSDRLNEVIDIIKNILKKTHFLLLNYKTRAVVTDTGLWSNGLGRVPKRSLEGKNITMLNIPNIEKNMISNDMLCNSDELFNFLALNYMKSLLKTMRCILFS